MVLDIANQTSREIGAEVGRIVVGRSQSGNAIYLLDDMRERVFQVASDSRGHWSTNPIGFPAINSLEDVAPDGSSAAGIDVGGLCLITQEAKGCTAILLPFQPGALTALSYTSSNRLVARASIGRHDIVGAVGFGDRVGIAIVDLETNTATQLDTPLIGDLGTVSPDGEFAWLEYADGKLVLAFAPLDRITAKKTVALGSAPPGASASCEFAGDRIVCVVDPSRALLSVSARDGSIVTLEPKNAIKGQVFPSDDGRWVAYERSGDSLEDPLKWFLTPIDRAAGQPFELDDSARVLAWLR